MMKKYLLIALIGISLSGHAQLKINKHYFPFGLIGKENTKTHGVSLGTGYDLEKSDSSNSTTNGIRLELIGVGILVPLIPQSPLDNSDSAFKKRMQKEPGQRINGFNISASGSVCDCETNGISTGLIGQINRKVNGISIVAQINIVHALNGLQVGMFNMAYEANGMQTGFSSYADKMHGLQAGVFNYTKKTKGVQIGLINSSEELRGFQFGLWNNNGKRKQPFINWRFREY